MKSYVFRVELLEEEDGRWSAGVPTLPGCATWGFTKEEALQNIRDAITAYIRDMQSVGEQIQQDAATQIIDEPVVEITI
jgi:antitoxin HicB